MNITANLPVWAQAPAQKFIAREEIAGTEQGQLDQDTFESLTQIAGGILTLASNDEVPGVDQAIGQPGVVSQEGLTVHFTGDPSKSDGEVEAVVNAKDGDSEIAIYVSSSESGFSALQMQKGPEGTVIQGGAVEQSFLGLGGFVIAGKV